MTPVSFGRRLSPTWLHAVSAVLVLLGLVALVAPVSQVTVRNVSMPPSADGQEQSAAQADRHAATIVRTNLFSASRRAPRVRFTLPGQETTSEPLAAPPVPADADGPELQGVLTVNGMRLALLRVPGVDSVPRVVRVGDRVGGYRVRAIGADRVELSAVSGTRIVRLRRKFPSDSNGVEP